MSDTFSKKGQNKPQKFQKQQVPVDFLKHFLVSGGGTSLPPPPIKSCGGGGDKWTFGDNAPNGIGPSFFLPWK
jgi:hypothetical protein